MSSSVEPAPTTFPISMAIARPKPRLAPVIRTKLRTPIISCPDRAMLAAAIISTAAGGGCSLLGGAAADGCFPPPAAAPTADAAGPTGRPSPG